MKANGASISIAKVRSQKRVYRYFRVTYYAGGRRLRRNFKSRADAEAFIKQVEDPSVPRDCLLADIKRHTGDVRLETAARWFLEASKTGRDGGTPLERYTLEGYASLLRLHILPRMGLKYLGVITPVSVRRFRDELIRSGVTRKTARKAVGLLSSIFNYMCLTGRMHTNPAAGVRVVAESPRSRSGAVDAKEIPTFQQMTSIFSALEHLMSSQDTKESWTRGAPIIFVAALCGLRNSEIRGLPRSALDWERSTLRIFQRCDRAGTVGLPKSSAGHRTLPVPERVMVQLQHIVLSHSYELVFCTKTGRPLSHSNINRDYWRPALRAAGIDQPFGFHRLRHYYASLLFEAGLPLPTISRLLGHSNPTFTLQTYIHLFEQAERGGAFDRARRVLDEAFR